MQILSVLCTKALCTPAQPRTLQAPVVQTLDGTIHGIKIYPVDFSIGLPNTYPLDSGLSGGYRHPTFERTWAKPFPCKYFSFPF